MLLFIKKPYYDAILKGEKTYEIRAGSRYSGVKTGDVMTLNGRARFPVTRIDMFEFMHQLPEDVSDCYDAAHPGPFFVFHLGPQIT